MNPPRSEKVVNTNGNNFKKIKEFFESFSVQIPTSNINVWNWYISVEFLKLKRKFKNKSDKNIIGISRENVTEYVFSKKRLAVIGVRTRNGIAETCKSFRYANRLLGTVQNYDQIYNHIVIVIKVQSLAKDWHILCVLKTWKMCQSLACQSLACQFLTVFSRHF